MRVLLSGGAGFIGSHVAEALLVRGHKVTIVDDLSSGKRENIPEGAHLYEADIRSGCAEIFEDFGPEALCHQAAQMDVRRLVREPDFDADVNVLGTIRLLENCVEYGVGKVVFASTGGAVYGEQREFPATEDHPQYPLSPYGVSKLAAERYLYYYHAQYGLPYVALRYSNVYGPRQDPHGEAGVVAIFSGNLAEGRISTINGTGEQTRDYVYVEDVARANVLALEGEVPSGAYNVGTGSETSVNELYELLVGISGKDLAPEHGPAKPGEQLRSSVDPTLAGRVMGWVPRGRLYFRSQGDPPLFWRSLRANALCGSKRRARFLMLGWEPQQQHGPLVTRGVEPRERCLLREAATSPPPRSGVSPVLHPHPISPVLVAVRSI